MMQARPASHGTCGAGASTGRTFGSTISTEVAHLQCGGIVATAVGSSRGYPLVADTRGYGARSHRGYRTAMTASASRDHAAGSAGSPQLPDGLKTRTAQGRASAVTASISRASAGPSPYREELCRSLVSKSDDGPCSGAVEGQTMYVQVERGGGSWEESRLSE